MEAQRPRVLGDLVVVGRDRPTVAEAGEVLGGVERKCRDVSERARAAPAEARSHGLSGVLEHGQAQFGDVRNGRRTAEQVNGHHGMRAAG